MSPKSDNIKKWRRFSNSEAFFPGVWLFLWKWAGDQLNLKILALILLGVGFAAGAPAGKTGAKPDSVRTPNRLAVLDLVDLADNQSKPEVADYLRRSLLATGKWSIFARDSVNRKLGEFNMNPLAPCNNPQCSFDIGNVVQADYVLYGTSSPLGSVQAVTLKLLHIPSAKVVWTRVVEAGGVSDAERARGLERAFATVAAELSQKRPEGERNRHGKSLAVIDLSENSLQSRVFYERVHTRIYGSPAYDLMSPTELAELLSALEINKYSIVPSLDNMIGLGQRLGVSSLLYSRLYRDGKSYIYRLAMYDVAGKSLVLELPPQPSEDLIKLLDYEKVFFNTLFSKEKEGTRQASVGEGGSKGNKALWISLGILGVGGGMAAYWVENLRKDDGGARPNAVLGAPPDPPGDTN
jgi:hypothetical protein